MGGRTQRVLGSSRVVTAVEFSVTPRLRDRVVRSNAMPRNSLEPASALVHRKVLWMVCGGPRVHRHIESLATRFSSPRVHWHIGKAYGWFVGVHECIGTSKVLQHGLAVHECIGISKRPSERFGSPRVHRHFDSEKPKNFKSTLGGRI